jgi:hypothetical protein
LQIDLVEGNRMSRCLGAHGGLASRAHHHGMQRSCGQAACQRNPHHCHGSKSAIRLARWSGKRISLFYHGIGGLRLQP